MTVVELNVKTNVQIEYHERVQDYHQDLKHGLQSYESVTC